MCVGGLVDVTWGAGGPGGRGRPAAPGRLAHVHNALLDFVRVPGLDACCQAVDGIHFPPCQPLVPADKQVFPKLDLVGWYAAGPGGLLDDDLAIHSQVGWTDWNRGRKGGRKEEGRGS